MTTQFSVRFLSVLSLMCVCVCVSSSSPPIYYKQLCLEHRNHCCIIQCIIRSAVEGQIFD